MTLYDLKKKKAVPARPSYPQTRELFLFMRQVLAERRGEDDPSRLMDAEVGALLNYDYKYTHQWRFGKKRMFDAAELAELARAGDVPLDILHKIAIGLWTADQAYTVYNNRRDKPHDRLRRSIKVEGISVEIEIEIPPGRIEALDRAIAQLGERLQARINNPEALVDDRQSEILAFEAIVEDLDLPRVAFYRKSRE
jgi:hypothetical protein